MGISEAQASFFCLGDKILDKSTENIYNITVPRSKGGAKKQREQSNA